jgi:branched-chain amino acid transport system substrate-binding protein
MSQKNETPVLLLSLLITLGLIGSGVWWFTNQGINKVSSEGSNSKTSILSAPVDTSKQENNFNQNSPAKEKISFGDKILSNITDTTKKQGVEYIASGNFNQSITSLEAARKAKPNDPETLIYLNNAKIGSGNSYIIAAVVPIGVEQNVGLEILRGVAQAQTEINAAGGINGTPIKVAIANDDNNKETSKQIARSLVENKQVLGIVGPFSSDVTLAAGEIYNSGKLVAISPTSTSVEITKQAKPYIFRTVPSDYIAARALADYMMRRLQKKKVAVFYSSQSNYSQSLKSEFVAAASLGGGQVTNEFDMSGADFSAAKSLEEATKKGAEVIMLAPHPETQDKALQVVQINQKKLNILAGDNMYSLKTLEVGRDTALNMVIAIPWHIDGNVSSGFPKNSRQLWNADVNWRTALAYDATEALIAALKKNPKREEIQKTLISSDFSINGASGGVSFLPTGDRNAPVQLVKVAPGNRSRVGFDFVAEP